MHLAVHAPDTERRRDTVRVAHLRRANPQQRLQNVQGFEIVAVILEVVGVRQQRGRDEPRILVGVDVDGVAHESLEVGRLGPDATQIRAVPLGRGRLVAEHLRAGWRIAVGREQIHESQHKKRPLPQPDGGGGGRLVCGSLQESGVGERQRARRDFRHPRELPFRFGPSSGAAAVVAAVVPQGQRARRYEDTV